MSAVESLGTARVVVIGGGIVGACIAYHLARSGVRDVVVVERDELASGSTSKSAGGIRGSFTHPTNIAMGLHGLKAYAGLAKLSDVHVGFTRNGYLYTVSDDTTLQQYVVGTDIQNRHGVESRMIGPDEVAALAPLVRTDNLLGALWSPADAHVSPETATMAYVAMARTDGVRFLRHCSALDIDVRGTRIVGVLTERGYLSTSTVICAAGAWSRQVAGMAGVELPVDPVPRRTVFTGPVLDKHRGTTPLVLDVPSNFWFLQANPGYLLGWSNPDEKISFDLDNNLGSWIPGLTERLEARAPALLDYGIASSWSGYYEMTPDANPVIDVAPDLDQFVIAAGFSGHGFQMAPAVGEIVRDLVSDREPGFDIDDFRLGRFASGQLTVEHNVV